MILSLYYFSNKEDLIKAIEEMREAMRRHGLSGSIESIIANIERNGGYIMIPIDSNNSNRKIVISSMVYPYTDEPIENLSRYSINKDEIKISYQINGVSLFEITIINKNVAKITIRSKFSIRGFDQEKYPSLIDTLLSINYSKKHGANPKEYLGYIRSKVIEENNPYRILDEIKRIIEEY